MLNDFVGALDRYRRAAELRERLGRPESGILVRLGIAHFRMGDLAEAADAFERAIEQYRADGDVRAEAAALNNLAGVRFDQGDVDGAIDAFRSALALVEGSGEDRPVTRRNLAAAERRRGNLRAAAEWAESGLNASVTIGATHETALCAVEVAHCLAEASARSGDPALAGEAATLLGGAGAMCDQLGGAALENGDIVWAIVSDIDPDATAHRDEGRELSADALVERTRRAAASLVAGEL
jgi:tetratricopeptide (TPR) repeat protein